MIPNLPNYTTDIRHLVIFVIENDLKEIYLNIYNVIRVLQLLLKEAFKIKTNKQFLNNYNGSSIETDIQSMKSYEATFGVQ